MHKSQRNSRGFTLIAALLMTILLSGVAVGLLFMVTNEARMGGNDLEGNLAYYAAEAQVENLTSELSQLYQTSQVPTAASINALSANNLQANAVSGSNISNIQYGTQNPSGYFITWPSTQTNQTPCPNPPEPCGSWDMVGAGQDQGMVATLIPFTINVTATRQASAGQVASGAAGAAGASGASANITRTVEVALLPAFEFGIFCDGDCDYFAGPPFNFGGRVHTNGNLFLAANTGPLTFTDKVTAVGQVILSQLENGQSAGSSSGSYNGSIYIPQAAGACPNAPSQGPATNCANLPAGSWTGGFPPTGSANSAWTGISKSTFNGFIENGSTGATKLQLPFVNSSKVGAVDIIRRPTPVDTSQIAAARLYNEASIRILLADNINDLHPDGTRADSATEDIMIGTPFTNLPGGSGGYYTVSALPPSVTGISTPYNMYFATAKKATGNWLTSGPPTNCTTTLGSWPLFGQVTASSSVSSSNCTGIWLRVEYCPTSAAASCPTNPSVWVGITKEWLSFGFGRNYNNPPSHPYNSSTTTAPLCKNYSSYPTGQCQNGVSPAILILQQLQSSKTTANGYEIDTTDSSSTAYNWLPLNFYDAREGEPRDARPSGDNGGKGSATLASDCSPVGIMNAVEIDVGNLWLWLQAKTSTPYSAGSGKLVNASTQNGYILYFSDHRGMIKDKYPLNGASGFYNGFSGMSGLNDIVNSGSSVGVPDGTLEAKTYYATASPTPYSPEDTAVKGAAVNLGNVDNWGQANLGAGFGLTTTGNAMSEPYYVYGTVTNNAIQCYSSSTGTQTAEWNMVTGPRHVLRLVDGGMDSSGNSYVPPTGGTQAANGVGFTVASEEPVYVWGDYNTGSADPFWANSASNTTPHSAAAVIADAVTLLSNPPGVVSSPSTNTGWTDVESFQLPACAVKTGNCAAGRYADTGYYRLAIIAGKSIPFPDPSWSSEADFGTDGGMHNFLRYLEDRSDNGSGATVNYVGSMISMYYSQYATGNFKCCTSVYGAPKRNYFFDTLFENPQNLPPGTPSFQDVVSLGYHQSFTSQ